MIKFSKFLELKGSRLDESGNMFSGINRIPQEDVEALLKDLENNILKKLKLKTWGEDWAVLGSAGKKKPGEFSGDIDIVIDAEVFAANNSISLDRVMEFLEQKLNKWEYETNILKGFNQISIKYPFKDYYVQVDFMLSDCVEWTKFIYHSPDFTKDESKYKGLYRNILLMTILSNYSKKIVKKDGDKVLEIEKIIVRLNKGLFSVRKSYEGKRGLLKTPILMKEYDKFITNNPVEIAKILFNDEDTNCLYTFESLWEKFEKNCKEPDIMYKVIEDFVETIQKLNYPIPSEFGKYIQKRI